MLQGVIRKGGAQIARLPALRCLSTAGVEMPPCDFTPQAYKGPAYDDVVRIRKANLSPALLHYYRDPVLVHQGHMQWLFDHEGRRYLDLFAGIVTVSVGHCHPKVVESLKHQLEKLWHTTNIYLHPGIHEYAEQLVAKMPGNLKVCYFTNSGSEANDLAMLMARLHTGAHAIVSLRNSYHGASPYTMGLTAMSTWRYNVADGFGIHHALVPDVYQGFWGGKNCRDCPVEGTRDCDCTGECQASINYVEQLGNLLDHSVARKRLAGFFAEPIQGVGGGVVLPKGYLKKAYELVRNQGGVCISDEVQTGFGRTGDHYWGFQMHDAMPDIVTMAKGIANGFPMAAVITTPEIAKTLSTALHFNTFGGNPMACATASSVMKVMEEEDTMKTCRDVGTYFLVELGKLRDEFEIVGDVRGKGLMMTVELVTDKVSKQPLDAVSFGDIFEETKNNFVLFGKGGLNGNCFRIKPPMCITKADVDYAIHVLRKALKNFQKKPKP